MSPAAMPALSWSLPSSGDTLSTVCCFWSNCTGSAPYFSTSARSFASPWVKVPLICTFLPVMPGWIIGADCTTPSSTIATCLPT